MSVIINLKKHKKHKKEKFEGEEFYSTPEKPPGLKLILKVGGNCNTLENPVGNSLNQANMLSQHYQQQLGFNYSITPPGESEFDRYLGHKKLKKKKKKKDKRHKHHHKEKKRRREESSQESVGDVEDTLNDSLKHKISAHQQQISIPPRSLVSSNTDQLRPSSSTTPVHPVTSGLSPHREPRTCVLRKIAEKSPLQRLLEHLLRSMEKRDPQQFFAWPVTDNIAPGYSSIITNPMDFSTIKQKIDDNNYCNLNEFISDFKLMCENAMTYNHSDTIYYKAAKKLLHVGLKMVSPEKLKLLRPVLIYMQDLTKEELGFELEYEIHHQEQMHVAEVHTEKECSQEDTAEESEEGLKENQRKLKLANLGKFEAIPDDLTPEEILKQAKDAAKGASDKLSFKKVGSKMGFLRQKKDGTTSLQILVPGDGVIPGTNQRPVSLGQLIGKLNHGTGSLAGFRDDRRNMSKPVKPLYYGAFGSYAPSYDSTFSNLSKEDSELVYQTYGDETNVQYAESIIDFAKDCDYTLTMVDDLLDILTNGEHRKTKNFLDEKKRLKEEEEKIKTLLESPVQDVNINCASTDNIKVDVDQLKSLAELGIDTNFLESIGEALKTSEEREQLQNRLDDTSNMINNLRQAQHCRLSAPPPTHLSNVPKAPESEVALAEKITDNLTDIAKKLPPSVIAPVEGLRRAMGIAPIGGPEPMDVEPITHNPTIITENTTIQENNVNNQDENMMPLSMSLDMGSVRQNQISMQMVLGHNQNNSLLVSAETSGVDLESELREFLESDPTLGQSPLHDDKTLEDILSES